MRNDNGSGGDLYDWLDSAGLLQYYHNFYDKNLRHCDDFLDVEMNDTFFNSTDIKNKLHRKKLLRLQGLLIKEHNIQTTTSQQQLNPIPCTLPYPQKPSQQQSKIQVIIRKRPMNKKEKKLKLNDILQTKDQSITLNEPKQKVDLTKYILKHDFYFDDVFNENITNQEIYLRSIRRLVEYIFYQGRSTCFAYGQTGAGKTYTIMGEGVVGNQPGLFFLATQDIFRFICLKEFEKLTIWFAFYEVYGGKLYDLLNRRTPLVCREDRKKRVNIVGLKEFQCNNVLEIMRYVKNGNRVRSTGTTGANIDSSRSHAIMRISLRDPQKPKKIFGKFSFVDLAGSERGADTQHQERQTRLEGAEINTSLLALKECIRALDQASAHKPFRQSKLTMVMRDSLIGNCSTVMLACLSPSSKDSEHTLNTLRYAEGFQRGTNINSIVSASSSTEDPYMPHNSSMNNSSLSNSLEYENIDEKSYDDNNMNFSLTPSNMDNLAISVSSSTSTNQYNDTKEGQDDTHIFKKNSNIWDYMKDLTSSFSESTTQDQALEFQRSHQLVLDELSNEIDNMLTHNRSCIRQLMEMSRVEVGLIKQVEDQTINYDEYAKRIDKVLLQKMNYITDFRNNLSVFRQHLNYEEILNATILRFPTKLRDVHSKTH